jgi:hypothetical protein
LEGLTFRGIPPAVSRATSPQTAAFRTAFAHVANGPLLAANCRFEFSGKNFIRARPIPNCVSLEDCAQAVFENCEFRTSVGGAIDCSWQESPRAGSITNLIVVRNCTQHGVLLTLQRNGSGMVVLELRTNTVAGGTLLVMIQHNEQPPLAVRYEANIFDGSNVIMVGGEARRLSPEKLFQWAGRHNLYSVDGPFLQASPAINSFEEWQGLPSLESEGAATVDLAINERLNGLVTPNPRLESQAFALSAAEREQLEKTFPELAESVGARLDHGGPGAAYDQWRQSPAYASWNELVQKCLAAE